MFSGIVEEVGQITEIIKQDGYWQFSIAAKTVLQDTKKGDSIAVNGVCLTVVEIIDNIFTLQVVSETLAKTTLSFMQLQQAVNLERAMLATTRIGGHLVQGHVDTAVTFKHFFEEQGGLFAEFSLNENIARYVIDKGFIALDGMSLTIAELKNESFVIAFIPYTFTHTIVKHYKPGQLVNVEVDMVAKYIERSQAWRKHHD